MRAAAVWAVSLPVLAGWQAVESEHYTLYTEGSEFAAREQLRSLEVFRWLALKLLRADERSLRAQARFEMVVLPGNMALRNLLPGLGYDVAGVYTYCREGAMAFATDDGRNPNEGISWGQVVQQHEVAHHLMFQYATVAYPAWYVEGFAEYLSTTWKEGNALVVGGHNRYRAFNLDTGAWLPFEEVLAWGRRAMAARTPSDTASFYAQSWLLMHYLLEDDTRAAALERYVGRVGAGEDPVVAFEAALGMPVAELETKLRKHLRQMREIHLKGLDWPKPTIRVEPLADDANAVLTDTLLLRTCTTAQRRDEIRTRLRTRAARALAGSATRRSLARAELLGGDAAAAAALLEPLLAADDTDAEAHYLMGRTWALRAAALQGADKTDALEQARGHLFKAYRAKKDDGPTLYHLAQVLAQTRGPTDANTLNAARAARAMAPAVSEYALFEAHLDLLAGEPERAVRALGPLASNPHDPARAARMRAAIAAIRAGVGLAEIEAAQKSAPAKDPP